MTSILSGGVLRTAPFCKVKIVDGADQDLTQNSDKKCTLSRPGQQKYLITTIL